METHCLAESSPTPKAARPAVRHSATGASGISLIQPGEESATARCPMLASQAQVSGAIARTLSSTAPW
ncbi:hypothetical protein FHR32_006608 [Streptosporangium album]|uniref:Uncharacterized protein n=1 Tax=Streptosporangium album TaxID=47479 RepID=A0A7W7WC43_9ACTN|nr:hypothetical protein [Streptosporangium album]MBB4942222.1 hypothetical protein [Streptosporangium album]